MFETALCVDESPSAESVASKTRIPLSHAEISRLYFLSRNHPRNAALLAIAINTGAKVSELLNLNCDQIIPTEYGIIIDYHRQPRVMKTPFIHLLRTTPAQAVRTHLAEIQDDQNPILFRADYNGNTGTRLTINGVDYLLKQYGQEIGRENLSANDFRIHYIRQFKESTRRLAEALGIGEKSARTIRAKYMSL